LHPVDCILDFPPRDIETEVSEVEDSFHNSRILEIPFV
jgi:hypothetical protein